MSDDAATLLCAKCLTELTPGRGDFFAVQIHAVADPSPPTFTEEDLNRASSDGLSKLITQLADCSEREAMDQVHRHVVVHLCNSCFETWIEDPVG